MRGSPQGRYAHARQNTLEIGGLLVDAALLILSIVYGLLQAGVALTAVDIAMIATLLGGWALLALRFMCTPSTPRSKKESQVEMPDPAPDVICDI